MTDIKELKEIDARFFGNEDTVHFYNICDVIDYVMPSYWGSHTKEANETMKELVEKFRVAHNMHFYSAPREDFEYYTAQKETIALGLTNCIVEDLS